jgi:uridine kinase
MQDKIRNLFEKIPKVKQGQRVVLGIDGLSRSGKTTFVRCMEQFLKEENISVCIFHIDDYIVERKKRYNTGNEEWYEYFNFQWDVEMLTENLFKRLKDANELHLLAYEYSSDTHKLQKTSIPHTCLIIIEGVFLQRKEWRNFYDLIVYLDCPREKRFHRESEETQKNMDKFEKRYWKAEEYYLKVFSPMGQADLIIQN